MNLIELKEVLETVGVPVAFSHFTDSQNEPLPAPPFIVYLPTFSANFMADNKVYEKMDNIQIELYTDLKDLQLEAILEAVLNEHELPFQTSEEFIEDEQLYQKIYEVRL